MNVKTSKVYHNMVAAPLTLGGQGVGGGGGGGGGAKFKRGPKILGRGL